MTRFPVFLRLRRSLNVALVATAIGAAVMLWLWPQPALADDCYRDIFNAEDCLRTPGWAPLIAGGMVSLIAFLSTLGEAGNTIASIRNGLPQMTASAGSSGGGLRHKGWWTRINEALLGANETAGTVTAEQAAAQRKRAAEIRKIARDTELPVRIAFGVVGVGGLFLTPLVGVPLLGIAVFYPDILSPILDFIVGEDGKE